MFTYAPLTASSTSSLAREAERKPEAMQVLYERCCGLDVHKKTVVACVLITSPDGQVHKQVRTVATTTAGLLALADWLATLQISHVAHDAYGDLLATGV